MFGSLLFCLVTFQTSCLSFVFAFVALSLGNPELKKSHPVLERWLSQSVEKREFTTNSGKKFVLFLERTGGASLVTAKLETSEFSEANDTFDLGEIDPVEDAFLTDLDQNGFEEFYFTTRSTGSGSYSSLYGYASNRDKSVSSIYVPGISDAQMGKGGFFNGFRGHNHFEIQDDSLLNIFPVYSKQDPNARPTGGKRKVWYRLEAGEASWILTPIRAQQLD